MSSDSAVFQKGRHIKYWLRCAKTFLPSPYTSNDSARMTLAFFIVAALDLLGVLETSVSTEERHGWIDWIYSCQVPEGGFRGFTGADVGELRNAENRHWDPANLPATFFALSALLVLGDDFSRLERKQCLEWLPKLQRANGSFGEVLGEGEVIEGGNDLRFCCCAAGTYHMLRGGKYEYPVDVSKRFDEGAMVKYINSCQTYEGGFSEGPFHEAHSGLTYCAVGALSFTSRSANEAETASEFPESGISIDDCMRWLLQRQTTYIEDDSEDDDDDEAAMANDVEKAATKRSLDRVGFPTSRDELVAGFNGRPNKIADTCYAWWNGGALAILDHHVLVDSSAEQKYLLAKVQHVVGGFGKGIGEPPDILHSYLGLAALALSQAADLKQLDPTFCMSRDAVRNLRLSA